ncbi:glycosyltransferase family 2 protein [Plebeiibacterium sediminum]|nr:glycosyltransferase family 2 protein [Plebeiobacterium sediminum]
MKVSIIVPIYNAEKTLARSLDSILHQTYTNLEILLINDGSTDESGHICKNYSDRDKRIIYFDKDNQGVSSVREFGVRQATGEYLIHFDSDDWAEPQMITEMVAPATKNKADIVLTDYYVDYEQGESYQCQKPTGLEPLQVLHDLLNGRLHGATWNKLVRTSIYQQYDIHFPKNINYCEDVLMWVELLKHNVTIAYLPQAYYHYEYNFNLNSITRQYTLQTLEQRKNYIATLERTLDADVFGKTIIKNKLRIKFEVFERGLLNNKEFKALYPETNRYIFNMTTSIINRILLFLASKGLTRFTLNLYNLKNKA